MATEQITVTPRHPATGFQADVFQSYLQGLKLYWKEPLYRDVVAAAKSVDATHHTDIETGLRHNRSYQLYGWLERNLQRFKYLGRHGMIPLMERQQSALSNGLDAAAAIHPERLQLDPDFRLPAYYVESDFHQHPGGIWSDDADAFAYEWAANAFSFSMEAASRPYTWLADYMVSRFQPTAVLDLGCGFGKLVIPFKKRDPSMTVAGVDLSAPVLRLAHQRAIEDGLEIELRQADAEKTGYPDASFDVVICYWLLHEMPPDAIRGVFREARRLLRPGGVFASYDMHVAPGGHIGAFLAAGHAARNNEPFLPGMADLDLAAEFRAAGFDDSEVVDALSGQPSITPASPLPPSRVHAMTVALAKVRA